MIKTQPALDMKNIRKIYPGVTALDNVDFEVGQGEVRALLGKNGAGKSTLIRIACGLEHPDNGEIFVGDKRVDFKNPHDAREQGVEIVSQELNIVPHLSVAENISLGRWPKRSGTVDKQEMRKIAEIALSKLNVSIDPDSLAKDISPAEQQLVEIARAISKKPSILLLDEPTSSLALPEVEALLETVKLIARQGVGVIYVSHRLAEISNVADSVTILRNGKVVVTAEISELNDSAIVGHMTGELIESKGIRTLDLSEAPVVLSLKNVSIENKVENISFDLKRGEVIGLAGLLGSGRSEILRAIAGFEPIGSGSITITIANSMPHKNNVKYMINMGVALSPENRRAEGIIPRLSVAENITMGQISNISKIGKISWMRVNQIAKELVNRLSIKTPQLETPIMNLSGGNQQKVVIGRWLDIAENVLLLDEPTRGVDVEAKNQIYEIIEKTAARGVSILVVTSELEELLLCCNSVIFLNSRKASNKFDISDLNIESINALANGGTVLS